MSELKGDCEVCKLKTRVSPCVAREGREISVCYPCFARMASIGGIPVDGSLSEYFERRRPD